MADPFQQKNLVDPAQKALMSHFDGIIEAWQKVTGDKFAFQAALSKISKQPDEWCSQRRLFQLVWACLRCLFSTSWPLWRAAAKLAQVGSRVTMAQ